MPRKQKNLTGSGPSKAPLEAKRQLTRITPELIERMREDIVSQRIPVERTTISDDLQRGLHVMFRKTGHVSFHIHHERGDIRAYMIVGHYPEGSDRKAGQAAIDDARNLADTIVRLADMGVDVTDGLYPRLFRELREKGLNWRPK